MPIRRNRDACNIPTWTARGLTGSDTCTTPAKRHNAHVVQRQTCTTVHDNDFIHCCTPTAIPETLEFQQDTHLHAKVSQGASCTTAAFARYAHVVHEVPFEKTFETTSGPNHIPFISTSRMKPNAMPAVMRDLHRTRITDPVYLDRQRSTP